MLLASRLREPSFMKATVKAVFPKTVPPSAPSLAPLLRGPEDGPWEEALPWMRSDPIARHSSSSQGQGQGRCGSKGLVPRAARPGQGRFLRDLSGGENSAFGESLSPPTSEKLEAVERPGQCSHHQGPLGSKHHLEGFKIKNASARGRPASAANGRLTQLS